MIFRERTPIPVCLSLVMLLLLAGAPGCKDYSEHASVLKEIKEATEPVAHTDKMAPKLLVEKAVVVEDNDGPFLVETRKHEIGRFQCSLCHKSQEVLFGQAAEMAHGTIIAGLNHGARNKPLACDTCHHQQDRDFLVTEEGSKIDFNHSYQLCGQCHFREKMDWAGGAHGKRVRNWAGKRLVRPCTSCHDPHDPRFEKRWPTTYSPPMAKK